MAELNLGIDIGAPIAKVYEALTVPEMLSRWFCEKSEISINDHRYDFWGRHTPDNPDRKAGRHKLVRAIRERLVEFEWMFRGELTTVQYELHESGSRCVLTMHHRDLPVAHPNQSSIGDFWSHALEGLRHWLERGRPYDLLDYSMSPRGDIDVSVEIDVAPSAVFNALTDAAQMERWVGSKGSVEPRVGGKIDFGWGMGPIKILDIVNDKKLQYSWAWEGEPETVTTWTLDGSGGKTRVTIVQSGFAPERNSEDYFIGWSKFASRLKTMLEEGPDWERVRVYANKERVETTTTMIDPQPDHPSEG